MWDSWCFGNNSNTSKLPNRNSDVLLLELTSSVLWLYYFTSLNSSRRSSIISVIGNTTYVLNRGLCNSFATCWSSTVQRARLVAVAVSSNVTWWTNDRTWMGTSVGDSVFAGDNSLRLSGISLRLGTPLTAWCSFLSVYFTVPLQLTSLILHFGETLRRKKRRHLRYWANLLYSVTCHAPQLCRMVQTAPLYRHWGSVQAVRPIGGVEV
jgi:hypothetical protein